MAEFNKPLSRTEAILQNMLGADNVLEPPVSREEKLLMAILQQGGGGGGATSLSDLDDVDTTGVAAGKVLKYDGTEQKWMPALDEGENTFAGLTDTDVSNPAAGQIPVYNASGKWENKTVINDSATTAANTWSADKINSEITNHLIADISNVTFGGE